MVVLQRLDIAKPTIRPSSTLNRFGALDGNIIGGTLLGIGMSLTGACPGTVLPQIAQGVQSARATALGGLLGGVAYAKFGKALVSLERKNNDDDGASSSSSSTTARTETPTNPPGPQTIATKFNLSPSAVWLVFEVLVLSTIALSSLALPGKTQTAIPTVAGGLLIAAAQALSILLTSTPLGVSAAYEQAGRLIWRDILGDKGVDAPGSRPPKALIFAAGILCGSLVAGPFVPAVSLASTSVPPPPVPTIQALVGGFALTFGGRVAGGCTSGHGLSGLAALSYSSLITTAAMFGGGIVAAHLMMI